MSESEWQPAIIAPVSEHGNVYDYSKWTKVTGQTIRVRPATPDERILLEFRREGCAGQDFAEVHPEDVARLDPDIAFNGKQTVVCEHFFLTD